MESSEDDAGIATSASRRVSAREKDVGLAVDVESTSCLQQESSQSRASYAAPAMCEDNYDGDSAPSPSTQDVNTSTEAILDMIDEFVDGPGAPKRISLFSEYDESKNESHETSSSSNNQPQIPTTSVDNSENKKCITLLSKTLANTETVSTIELPEISSASKSGLNRAPLPTNNLQNLDSKLFDNTLQSDVPSSIVVNTVDSSKVCVSETVERTVKCVSSSDNKDNVVVKNAESTSSDNSVSEYQGSTNESRTRSPLRRRLVRPVVSDRRADTTVSSTADSQVTNINILEHSICQNLAKDVSSSSDATPVVYDSLKPEEIRNLSHISVCKAETSASPPKKIKLIRQKVISNIINKDNSEKQCSPPQKEPCQSTSVMTMSRLCPESTSCSQPILEKVDQISTKTLAQEFAKPQDITNQNIEQLCPPMATLIKSDKDNEQERQRLPSPVKNCPSSSKLLEFKGEQTDPNEQDSENVNCDVTSQSIFSSNPSTCDINNENNLSKEINEKDSKICSAISDQKKNSYDENEDHKKVPPIKLNLSTNLSEAATSECNDSEIKESSIASQSNHTEGSDNLKQVPKLTIKLNKHSEDSMCKSPIPKLTIKPIRPPTEEETIIDSSHRVSNVSKLNIKNMDKSNDFLSQNIDKLNEDKFDQKPSITRLNIKPIPKPPEKINDIHRKSSSSEISESEYSENDESTSTSDQASASDQGSMDVVPKVTIKLGKPGAESEGKFYTAPPIPKLTIKTIQQSELEDPMTKSKLVISQSEDHQSDKIPKITIKTVSKVESQPLSPKITIKPVKPPELLTKDTDGSNLKFSIESSNLEIKDNMHVPKITIKPITRTEIESGSKTPKKLTSACDTMKIVPIVTKLNIKPIMKPLDEDVASECLADKVPLVSKLNIKPVIKPIDNDIDCKIEDIPKITKINIKPLNNPEENSTNEKDCDVINADIEKKSVPLITKLNIKPIVKPADEETFKDIENQSSETGNSSDDNSDHIPVVTKINIKPIIKPIVLEDSAKHVTSTEQNIPIVTKLNIKPLVKPEANISLSPKKEFTKNPDIKITTIPTVTKLNIKPVIKPEELSTFEAECEDKSFRNPPLVMKINIKAVPDTSTHEDIVLNKHVYNNIVECVESESHAEKSSNVETDPVQHEKANEFKSKHILSKELITANDQVSHSETPIKLNSAEKIVRESLISTNKELENIITEKGQNSEENLTHNTGDSLLMVAPSIIPNMTGLIHTKELTNIDYKNEINPEASKILTKEKQMMASVQNCTLLKKLLETTKDIPDMKTEKSLHNISNCITQQTVDGINILHTESLNCIEQKQEYQKKEVNSNVHLSKGSSDLSSINDASSSVDTETQKNVTRPLEINTSEKLSQGSGQDSPRIILKINKTDHGSSAKIITEDTHKLDSSSQCQEITQDTSNEKQALKRELLHSKKIQAVDSLKNMSTGKRLRSSRVVNSDNFLNLKRNTGKRPTVEISPPLLKDSEIETKRLKLGQLLSSNKSLSITPVVTPTIIKTSPEMKQPKTACHSILNNENCSKNGNSKLHNILSNLQANQIQVKPFNVTNCSEKSRSMTSEPESYTSTGSSSDVVEVPIQQNSHSDVQDVMIISESSDFRDFGASPDEVSRDPLEVDSSKVNVANTNDSTNIPKAVEFTPQPKKRGRPRKLPVSEPSKPTGITLPVPALEERPQRSLRLMRDRPLIIAKPRRGRGRGRGGRRPTPTPTMTPVASPADEGPSGTIDPTSSRIKLPRMTEALDKMPGLCNTPVSSRVSVGEVKVFVEELKVDSSISKCDEELKTPEPVRGRGSRGRGGRGRTPRSRGRGRGGGRGAVYMKETMGIYGRVCGPATTTVQLFEEETCMMDDNATPAKSSHHILDEDSQSSVKSSTNDSNKMKKSKFADLFDSNKVWTAADVKEYMWPPPEKPDIEHHIMMIQEQVAMFLGVKSFKRRYPELKRRTIGGEERDYVLSKGLVTEALCDLGITAVDASEVLDIMLSDYPHKYEEYRSHQRERQQMEPIEEKVEIKVEEKPLKVEMRIEMKVESKPELPKVDPEKARQELCAAAVASAAEWNARVNALRRPACADLQSLTVLRPGPSAARPAAYHVRPPAGFYPHALLPAQYQHTYRVYTPDQLRYFPLNTVMCAPPVPPSPVESSSDSEPDWSHDSSSGESAHVNIAAKRKKLVKVKRSSQTELRERDVKIKEEIKETEGEDTCRVCKLRLEANRKHTHERFLVCANCNAKLHPWCVELSADTIRKCREYGWQCAECKTCAACALPADDDKMLFCDLCDRGFHIYCVGLAQVPTGRWHCVECAICKSCGAREPGGLTPTAAPACPLPPTWHHQTRRGPGGHKVYSHSLCTPCARAYRIGRYCPLCEKSFIGPKGTMQLVICKLCDRQLHQECVRATVSALSVLDYTCGECRRGGITSRAAAVRLAPRTIATLFMAKRRFNKYAHRQYLASRRRASPDTSNEPPEPDD